jgi:hypothetical protein
MQLYVDKQTTGCEKGKVAAALGCTQQHAGHVCWVSSPVANHITPLLMLMALLVTR